MLPIHLKPPKNKLEKLETIRESYKLPNLQFFQEIATSRWAVIKTQEATLERLRTQFPLASEEKLWGSVILSRLEAKLRSPSPTDPPRYEIIQMKESIDEIMKDIHSWDDVIKFILNMDKEMFDLNVLGFQSEINKILESKN